MHTQMLDYVGFINFEKRNFDKEVDYQNRFPIAWDKCVCNGLYFTMIDLNTLETLPLC